MNIKFVTDSARLPQLAALIPSAQVEHPADYPDQHHFNVKSDMAFVGFGIDAVTVFGVKRVGSDFLPLEVPIKLISSFWIDK